jgi:N-methylhydantoinase A/oxoprolinase/acetone carboxylase beta subunit
VALISLGIDTGGTYTDAVLYCQKNGVIACAKSLTTSHDLSIGINLAVHSLMFDNGVSPHSIGLVSMSTTLATNALVEKQGGRVAFIGIGFEPVDFTKNGFQETLGTDPLILISGGHDAASRAKPLDLDALEVALSELSDSITAVGIAAMFAVRNPEHEIAARNLVRRLTHIPVTLSHELSSKLGGPKRALTTLLNARLIGLINRLIGSTQSFLQSYGITAPLMIVRGDGSLVSAAFAAQKPIETILSGPAASLVAAHFLTKIDNAIVCDIGGTTTDIGILTNGRPRLHDEGATVGGLSTSVEGVAMNTFGLGSDSELSLSDGLKAHLKFGPRRILPLSLVDAGQAETVKQALNKQLANDMPNRLDGRFAMRAGLENRFAAGLNSIEEMLYKKLTAQLQPLTELISSATDANALDRLVARGLAIISGLTPTDAQHVLGCQSTGNKELAELGVALFARKRDGRGHLIFNSEAELAHRIIAELENQSSQFILQTALNEDGLDGENLVLSPLIKRAMNQEKTITQFHVKLDRPIIALGASAQLIYPKVGKQLNAHIIIPPFAHVANAIGAVVGEVRVKVIAEIHMSGDHFMVTIAGNMQKFELEQSAIEFANEKVSQFSIVTAQKAGAHHPHIEIETDIKTVDINGVRTFISANICATAYGRPKMSV